MEMRGERQGRAALAHAGLPTKAAETNVDKATSGLARPPARDLSLSPMAGGGGGRRLALAGRRLSPRCVLVDEHGGRGGCMPGGQR